MKISTVVAFPVASSLSPPPSLCFCSSSRSYHSIPYSSFPFVFFSLSLSLSNQKGVLKRVEPSSSPPTLQSLFDLVYEVPFLSLHLLCDLFAFASFSLM
ncbi:hypothetical protein RchiOBHm_Chr1g0371571 [Rosa chinensis]|uniref:Uncharacterized protein n=1 Tax=Rosa chinensis TaxID=74649 RepID=A0A2P6SLJ6_ROSCH|nr:hypothetical protein RchiOBHm_Chr1g0371571 [Rosa chinensis]